MALAYPDRIEALTVQGANWKARRASWADRAANEVSSHKSAFAPDDADAPSRKRSEGGSGKTRIRGQMNLRFLNRPGQAEIQSDLFYDYRTNVDAYPKWQGWLRAKQPRLLVVSGKYDLSFDLGEPERYRKGVPNAHFTCSRPATLRSIPGGSDCAVGPWLHEVVE